MVAAREQCLACGGTQRRGMEPVVLQAARGEPLRRRRPARTTETRSTPRTPHRRATRPARSAPPPAAATPRSARTTCPDPSRHRSQAPTEEDQEPAAPRVQRGRSGTSRSPVSREPEYPVDVDPETRVPARREGWCSLSSQAPLATVTSSGTSPIARGAVSRGRLNDRPRPLPLCRQANAHGCDSRRLPRTSSERRVPWPPHVRIPRRSDSRESSARDTWTSSHPRVSRSGYRDAATRRKEARWTCHVLRGSSHQRSRRWKTALRERHLSGGWGHSRELDGR
jgi:hypothetical protein